MDKILVPIDSIEHDNTLTAVKDALELASTRSKPELIFLHILNFKSRMNMSERERLRKMKQRKIEDEFETLREMCEEENISEYTMKIEDGAVVEKILQEAKEKNVDVIVMGSGKLHDKSVSGKINKFFYGSVTEDVIHRAPCSIFVARPNNLPKKQ